MKPKKILAKLLKKAAQSNVASVSGAVVYQPEVPESLQEDE
ncbi:AgrD family cyclic lactone autoinducer peptide [Fuchsiella alkaliacetigena]|nr:cyclic lactone autoinducer peptide [Fuchsiella alkaliacetigena]MCK8824559.1 cyclic lactone autoinducer peptide [Fuchsiella alkaliacetigena]